jgi:hypothetical protein
MNRLINQPYEYFLNSSSMITGEVRDEGRITHVAPKPCPLINLALVN